MNVVPLSIIVLKGDSGTLFPFTPTSALSRSQNASFDVPLTSFRIDNGVIFDRTRVVPWVCPPKMELRPALSEIKGKDAGREMNGVLEEGGVIEIGNGRESHAKDPRRYE